MCFYLYLRPHSSILCVRSQPRGLHSSIAWYILGGVLNDAAAIHIATYSCEKHSFKSMHLSDIVAAHASYVTVVRRLAERVDEFG